MMMIFLCVSSKTKICVLFTTHFHTHISPKHNFLSMVKLFSLLSRYTMRRAGELGWWGGGWRTIRSFVAECVCVCLILIYREEWLFFSVCVMREWCARALDRRYIDPFVATLDWWIKRVLALRTWIGDHRRDDHQLIWQMYSNIYLYTYICCGVQVVGPVLHHRDHENRSSASGRYSWLEVEVETSFWKSLWSATVSAWLDAWSTLWIYTQILWCFGRCDCIWNNEPTIYYAI